MRAHSDKRCSENAGFSIYLSRSSPFGCDGTGHKLSQIQLLDLSALGSLVLIVVRVMDDD